MTKPRYLFLLLIMLCSFSLQALSISEDEITIHFSASDSIIAENILNSFSKTIFQFQKKIGQYPNLPVEIILTADDSEYFYLTKTSKIIEFSNAHYNPKTGKIYIRNPKNGRSFVRLETILLHEYIHHFVRHYWKNPPLWFNEGMAVYFSNDLSFDRELNFIRNYILGNSRTLEMMKRKYPENRIEWEAFYAKSALAVKYLYKNENNAFYKLWENSAPDKNFERAFRISFFKSTREFSNFFEDYSAKHFRIEILLASSSILWGLLPLILLIGWIRRKIKIKKIEKQWREEESVMPNPLEDDDQLEKM